MKQEKSRSFAFSAWLSRPKSRPVFIGLALFVVALIVARLALPWAIKNYVNKVLNEIPGYYGHVDDVHVALWRGAYSIREIEFVKKNGVETEPLFAADSVDFSVDWRALFHRRLVCKVNLERPKLQFVQRESKEASQTSVDKSWQSKLQALIPLDINRLAMNEGLIRYKDETSNPRINLFISRLHLIATNISNSSRLGDKLPSSFNLDGMLLKTGVLKLNGKGNFIAEPALGELKLSLRSLDLKELNAFATAYGNFDFKDGEFELTTEIAATKTSYVGYAKTIAKRVDVLDWTAERKQGKTVVHLLWEGLVGGIIQIFKNGKKDQFAARIPIEGTRSEVKFGTWASIASILRNGFVQALSPKFEDSVNYSKAAKATPEGGPDGKPEKGPDAAPTATPGTEFKK